VETCAECGGTFPFGDLTWRAVAPRKQALVCRRRCAEQIDNGRGLQPVSRARVHVECPRCGGEYGGDEPHVCAVDCLTADEGEG
jgi:hypothetical protein